MRRMGLERWKCAIKNIPELNYVLLNLEPINNINYIKYLDRRDVGEKIGTFEKRTGG